MAAGLFVPPRHDERNEVMLERISPERSVGHKGTDPFVRTPLFVGLTVANCCDPSLSLAVGHKGTDPNGTYLGG